MSSVQEPVTSPASLNFHPKAHTGLIVDDLGRQVILLHPREPRWALTNRTGLLLARWMDGSRSTEDLAADLAGEFPGLPVEQAREDVHRFVMQLDSVRLLENGSPRSAAATPAGHRPKPDRPSLTIYITEECNLRCKHCSIVEGKMPQTSLTNQDVKDLIVQHTTSYHNPQVGFLGGEPFLREDCIELLEFARQHTSRLAITTNGLLITEDVAARLAAIDGLSLQVSLDGADPEMHDFIRGKGSFRKTWAALELLCRHGMGERLTVGTVLTRCALPQIEKFMDGLGKLGIGTVRFMNLNKLRAAETNWDRISPDPEELKKVFRYILFVLKARPEGELPKVASSFPGFVPDLNPEQEPWCPLGKTFIVDSQGQTYNCPILNTPEYRIGDIRKDSLVEMEHGEKNQALRNRMLSRRYTIPECAACAWRNFCQSGCQASMQLRSGSMFVTDEFCEFRRDLYREHVLRKAGEAGGRG